MKISELMNTTMSELNSLSEADLKSAFSNAKRSFSARQKYFDKLGMKQTIPNKFMNVVNKDNPSRTDLLNAVLSARGHFQSKLSTARGKQAFETARRNALKDRLGLSEMSDSQFDQYGKFMGAMQERYKEVWKQVSFAAWKIATEAVTRNLDPDQFAENFEYWQDHLEDIEDTMDSLVAGDELFDSESMDEIEPEAYEPAVPVKAQAKHRSARKAKQARQSRSRKGRRR